MDVTHGDQKDQAEPHGGLSSRAVLSLWTYDTANKRHALIAHVGAHYGIIYSATFQIGFTCPTDRAWHLIRLGNRDFDHTWVPDHTYYGHNPADISPFFDLFPSDVEKSEKWSKVTVVRKGKQKRQVDPNVAGNSREVSPRMRVDCRNHGRVTIITQRIVGF